MTLVLGHQGEERDIWLLGATNPYYYYIDVSQEGEWENRVTRSEKNFFLPHFTNCWLDETLDLDDHDGNWSRTYILE